MVDLARAKEFASNPTGVLVVWMNHERTTDQQLRCCTVEKFFRSECSQHVRYAGRRSKMNNKGFERPEGRGHLCK